MKKQSFVSLLFLLFSLTLGLLNCKKSTPDPVKPGTSTPGSTTTTPGTTTSTTPATPATSTATAPAVNTATAPTTSGITTTSATVSAVIDASGGVAISQHGFVYSKTIQVPTLADSKTEKGTTTGPFPLTVSATLSGLDTNTTYYVRAYATNEKGTGYGAVGQFKTTTSSPNSGTVSFDTQLPFDLSNLTSTGFVLQSTILGLPGTVISKYGHVWSKTIAEPTIADSKTERGSTTLGNSGLITFGSSLTGLDANTTYRIRPYAVVNGKTLYAEFITTVKTQPAVVVDIKFGSACVMSAVSKTGFTLAGQVTGISGVTALTEHGFIVQPNTNRSTDPNTNWPEQKINLGSLTAPKTFSTQPANLSISTQYNAYPYVMAADGQVYRGTGCTTQTLPEVQYVADRSVQTLFSFGATATALAMNPTTLDAYVSTATAIYIGKKAENYKNWTVLAGGEGQSGTLDGTGAAARFSTVRDMVVTSKGDLLVADGYGSSGSQYRIRYVTAQGAVTSLAGRADGAGSTDGQGTAATFRQIKSLTIDAQDNLYLIDLHTVRKMTPDGTVSTLCGNRNATGSVDTYTDGTLSSARFYQLQDITIDKQGNLYVTDLNRIRRISATEVSSVAGRAVKSTSDGARHYTDGTIPAVDLSRPGELIITDAGVWLIADNISTYTNAGNSGTGIRQLTATGLNTLVGNPSVNQGLPVDGRADVSRIVSVNNMLYINKVVYFIDNGTTFRQLPMP